MHANTVRFRSMLMAGFALAMATIAGCSDPQENANAAKTGEAVMPPSEPKTVDTTVEELTRRAEQGDASAQYNLGMIYLLQQADSKVPAEAWEWLRKAAEQGHVQAQLVLAGYSLPAEAVKWYRKAAEQGHADAQLQLGISYEVGAGVPKDATKAVEWYRKAAEQGNVFAQFRLGEMYDNGEGIPKAATKAAEWYRKAAEQGYVYAQLTLGEMYADGEGVRKDATKAVEWYRRAAEQGHARAQYNMGVMYENGAGVPKDVTKAVEWYRKAAEQRDGGGLVVAYEKGHAGAQFNLGVAYANGEGVPKDPAKAVAWFRKAAEQGHAGAQFNLGVAYANGEGIPKDMVLAYAWLNLAVSNPSLDSHGRTFATEARDSILAPAMPPAQIAEAQQLSSNWKQGEGLERVPASRKGPPVMSFNEIAEVNREPAKQLTGTAFFVSAAGLAITNNHVVKGCKEVTTEGKGKAFQVLTADAANDLALLQLPESRSEAATLRAQPSKVRQGQEVVVFGFPLNSVLSSGGNLTPGVVSALTGVGNNSSQIQITAPIQPGSSGSPVLDKQGNIVGVVAMKLSDNVMADAMGTLAQNVNFAVSGQTLAAFLDANRVPYKHGRSWFVRDKSLADLADEARKWTVVVECWK